MLVKHSENLKTTFKLKKEETKRDWYEKYLLLQIVFYKIYNSLQKCNSKVSVLPFLTKSIQ